MEIHPVLFELNVIFMPPESADEPSQTIHNMPYQIRRKPAPGGFL
jgi:hypothetical protein